MVPAMLPTREAPLCPLGARPEFRIGAITTASARGRAWLFASAAYNNGLPLVGAPTVPSKRTAHAANRTEVHS